MQTSLRVNTILIFVFIFEQGLIDDITISHAESTDAFPVVSSLKGKPYTEDNLSGIIDALKGVSTDNVRQAINGS